MASGARKASPENKRQAKEKAAAAKQQQLAASALASLPEHPEKRMEIFAELRKLEADAKSFNDKIAHQKKRMRNVFGMLPKALRITGILESCKDGEYEAVLQQVQLFMKDRNRPVQLSLDLQPGKGVASDGKDTPLFDQTKAGGKVAREDRGSGPGQARPVGSKATETPAQPSPGIPLEEAQAKLEAASAGRFKTEDQIAAEKKAVEEQKARDAQEFEEKAGDKGEEGNVVQLAERRGRGRPAMTPEQKAKAAEERKAAKQASKKAATPSKKSIKSAADRAEAQAKSPKPPAAAPNGGGAGHEPAPEPAPQATPSAAPDFEEGEIPPVTAAAPEPAEPSGGYTVVA